MACFLVPMALAIVTTIIQLLAGHSLSQKLKLSTLNVMLWGGVALLAAEHVYHGEITAFAPYLTAMATPADTAVMLAEMGTIGTSMAVVISATWMTTLAVSSLMTKRVQVKDALSPLSKPITTR